MKQWTYGETIEGLTVDGREIHAPVFNENEVRAAAGITMALGAVAFVYANFEKVFEPIQIVTIFFFVDFLVRVTVGLRYSPVGVVARRLARRLEPQWASAKPKRFAWTLGLIMSFAMMVITNSDIHGALPRTICLICLALMWMESVLSLCLGCEIYGFLVRRGWMEKDESFEICVGGACDISRAPTRAPAPSVGS
jgi:magnesium-transporting ATPase (P-type)